MATGAVTASMSAPLSFEQAPCYYHDVCYGTHTQTRLGCDVDFFTDMLSSCYASHDGGFGQSACEYYASLYYTGVRVAGGRFYDNYSEETPMNAAF